MTLPRFEISYTLTDGDESVRGRGRVCAWPQFEVFIAEMEFRGLGVTDISIPVARPPGHEWLGAKVGGGLKDRVVAAADAAGVTLTEWLIQAVESKLEEHDACVR